ERFLLTERDLGAYFIPPRFFWVESIRHGDLPLWNPYQFSGHPFFANPQHAILYPLNGLFFLLPFDMAFNAIIILHFFLGGLFTYLFLKDLKVNSTGALISGLIFMLSGYLLSVHSLLTILLSSVWTPLIMMFFRRAIGNPGSKNEIITALFITISFLGGGIEIVYGNFLVLLSMIIFSPQIQGIQEGDRRGSPLQNKNSVGEPPRGFPKWAAAVGRPYWNRFQSLFIVSAIFLLLSAIQLIPFVELFIHSIRGKGLSYQEATIWSFAPKDVLLFFLPDVYGYFVDMKKYWINQCWFKTLYTGGLPFILSLLYFLPPFRKEEGGKGPGETRGLYLSLIVLSLFLSLGQYNPLYPFVFKHVPFFNGIRYPVKFLYIFILILSITAGLGFQRMTESSRKGGNRKLKNLLISLSLTSGFFLLLFVLGHKEIESFLKGKGIDTPAFSFLSVNLYHAKRFFFYLALFFLTLRVGYEVKWRGWIKVLLVLFLAADLFGNMGFYGKEKTQDYFQKTRILEIISSDQDHFRIFSTAKTISTDVPILLGHATYIDYLKEKHLPSMNLLYKLHDIWGIDVIHLKRIDDVYRAFTGTPSISSNNLVDLYSMKYIISVTPIEKDPRFELIYSRLEDLQGKKEELLRGNTIKLYRNRNPFPRAWLVKDHRVLDEKFILAILSGKEFNPRKEVLLEEIPQWVTPNSELRTPNSIGGLPEIVSETNNRLLIRVKAAQNAFLVLSDTYFPGWKAYLDGKPVKIFRANYNFRAVSIPPGKHEVKFVYHPMSVKLGVLVTSLGIIGILVMGLCLRFKVTKRRGVPLRTPSGKENI
ncbi:MAG: hypothetical protein A2157_06335, partial [Deltaproteobacteria bacterium RBG_16_47_11]